MSAVDAILDALDEPDETETYKQYLDDLRLSLPHVEYGQQDAICLYSAALLDTEWAAQALGDLLMELSETHKVERFRELRLSLVYLRSGYSRLLSFLNSGCIGKLILDGYGELLTYEDEMMDNTSDVVSHFLRAVIPSCNINELAVQGNFGGVPASAIAGVLCSRQLSALHLDEPEYTSAADITTLANSFRNNVGLRELHLDISSSISNACVGQIIRNLPSTLERLTVELPLSDDNALQPIITALSELLAKNTLQTLNLRHFDFRKLSLVGFDFSHLPELLLHYCDFAALGAEHFVQAARNVRSLSLHGSKFGGTNHLLYYTLSSLSQLQELRLDSVKYPNLSPVSLFQSFNTGPLQSLQVCPEALPFFLPHMGLLERLESFEIVGPLPPFEPEDIPRKAFRCNRSLLSIVIDGRPRFQGYCQRNHGLRATLSLEQMHLLPSVLQQVAPCHDAVTWTARALLEFARDSTTH